MDRGEYHQKLDCLLDLIANAPDSANERDVAEHTAQVSNLAVRLMDCVAGDYMAHQIYAGGHSPLPDEALGYHENNIEKFNKRGLAVALEIFHPFFEKAKLAVRPLQRDLIEMSKDSGADALLLTLPKRSKGQKNHRDLKKRARRRVCTIIYQEHGRTGEPITSIKNKLLQRECGEAERKAWDRMVKEFSKARRQSEVLRGKNLEIPHKDANPVIFRIIWQWANLK